MARAGYCHDCGAYVYLDDAWACPSGHARERVNGWYDPDTGQPLTPPWEAQPASPQPAAPANDRTALLQAIMTAIAAYPGYAAAYGTDTDIVLSNKVADGSWGTGKKKVEFEAIMKAVEPERTLYYWEILKETGMGVSLGGFESESYSTFGGKRWGTKKEVIIGPTGGIDYSWDYAKTRQIVEATAAQLGWRVKTVLRRGAAQW